MTRAILLASLLLACCPDGDHLTVTGEQPPLSDDVLATATLHCGRDLVGKLAFVPAGDPSLQDGSGGHCAFNDCGMIAAVAWDPAPNGPPLTALNTAEAHEIGHYCLQTGDENAVEAWAWNVNVETAARLGVAFP